jgi:hypothetical protein
MVGEGIDFNFSTNADAEITVFDDSVDRFVQLLIRRPIRAIENSILITVNVD